MPRACPLKSDPCCYDKPLNGLVVASVRVPPDKPVALAENRLSKRPAQPTTPNTKACLLLQNPFRIIHGLLEARRSRPVGSRPLFLLGAKAFRRVRWLQVRSLNESRRLLNKPQLITASNWCTRKSSGLRISRLSAYSL